MIALPNIESREKLLQESSLTESQIRFILTAEELKSSAWFEELELDENPSPDDEYERLLAILIGSQYMTINNQVLS